MSYYRVHPTRFRLPHRDADESFPTRFVVVKPNGGEVEVESLDAARSVVSGEEAVDCCALELVPVYGARPTALADDETPEMWWVADRRATCAAAGCAVDGLPTLAAAGSEYCFHHELARRPLDV